MTSLVPSATWSMLPFEVKSRILSYAVGPLHQLRYGASMKERTNETCHYSPIVLIWTLAEDPVFKQVYTLGWISREAAAILLDLCAKWANAKVTAKPVVEKARLYFRSVYDVAARRAALIYLEKLARQPTAKTSLVQAGFEEAVAGDESAFNKSKRQINIPTKITIHSSNDRADAPSFGLEIEFTSIYQHEDEVRLPEWSIDTSSKDWCNEYMMQEEKKKQQELEAKSSLPSLQRAEVERWDGSMDSLLAQFDGSMLFNDE